MRQSSVIFATLLFAFVIYITLRGQLPDYLALFERKKTADAPAATTGTDQKSGSKSIIDKGLDRIKSALEGLI